LCPTPGICAVILLSEDKKTLATGLLAEFGFLGVTILALFTVPFFCGFFLKQVFYYELFF